MREVLTVFMATYAEASSTQIKSKDKGYNERRLRRKAIVDIVAQLEAIRDAEEQYKENMPENLRSSSRYETAEQAVEALGEAIELLEAAFS
jgi:ribonuclease D